MKQSTNHTLRIAKILAWEFWACDWPGLFLGMIAGLFLPGAIVAVAISKGHWERELPFVQTVLSMVVVYWITIVCLGSILLQRVGKPRVRYTLPAPSWLLVASPLACGMATMFVQYAVFATILNRSLGLEWPIVGPGLLAAVLLGWCYAVYWLTSNSVVLRLVVWLASFVLLPAWGHWYTPRILGHLNAPLLGPMKDLLPSVSYGHALLFCLATLACLGIGTAGFGSLRHGSAIDLPRILEKCGVQFHFLRTARRVPFSSARSAQFWLEWMQRGYALLLTTTLLGVGALGLACYVPSFPDERSSLRFAAPVTVLFFLQLVLVGFFWGCRSPGFGFGDFGASRPLSDRQIAAAILRSATFSLFASAAIWIAFMLLAVLILSLRRGMIGPFGAVRTGELGQALAAFTLGALITWSATGFVTSLAVAGRRVIRDALLLAFGAWVLGLALHQCLPGNIGPQVAAIYFNGWFVLVVLGCAAAFIASWRRSLISNGTLGLAASLVLLAVATFYYCEPQSHIVDWQSQLFMLGRCCMVPIPLAAAPLAVYHNRHR
ncbi:MAG TPA: hypothetical protein VHY91_10395 [Pirellulales bacterium]|jgi:hypothetical protein|nr:hypothetical protein [Pirellulales bacterium]